MEYAIKLLISLALILCILVYVMYNINVDSKRYKVLDNVLFALTLVFIIDLLVIVWIY